ncbi:class I SAM-dependent methyltransferase [Litorivivens sp.]|uniref:class I SAM-dependent methyltransferase n=1 Tax=Litorivivens sp. TaxID=2020868 RepID=UPI003565CCD6
MASDGQRDQAILASWEINASPWVRAVRERQIASREQVTNQAIISTLTELAPSSLLDVGCGEGWLCRTMRAQGCDCLGIDAIESLVSAAREKGGHYRCLRYEDLSDADFSQRFDCAVCNFSLIGKGATELVFAAMAELLSHGGHLVVQTLHPHATTHTSSGWQDGSWAGFSEDFQQPAPWYFRTLNDWRALFQNHNFTIEQELAPSASDGSLPLSLILVGRLNSQ